MARRWLGWGLAVLAAAAAVAYVLWPEPPLEPSGYSYHVQGGFADFDLLLDIDASGKWTYRDAKSPARQAQGQLTPGQLSRLRRLTQEVDWPRLPPRFLTSSPPADELLRAVEVRTPHKTYQVTAGSVAPVPSPLTNLFNFLEGVRRAAEATLPPRFSLVTEGPALFLVGAPGQKEKLLDLGQLPTTFRPHGSQEEFGVGKEGFGPVALSPGGTKVAWATLGLHPLVGYVSLKDFRPVPLDLYYAGAVQAISWAPDESHLAVQAQTPAGGATLRAYTIPGRAAVPFPGRERFSPAAYHLLLRGWREEHTLSFVARPLAEDGEETGWLWNLETGRLSPETPSP